MVYSILLSVLPFNLRDPDWLAKISNQSEERYILMVKEDLKELAYVRMINLNHYAKLMLQIFLVSFAFFDIFAKNRLYSKLLIWFGPSNYLNSLHKMSFRCIHSRIKTKEHKST